MSSLPEELYLDILLRVPVRCTFVCKCVCKSWFSIISDPDFVKSHINLTTKTNNYSLLIQRFNTYLNYDSLSSSSNESVLVELDYPYKYQRKWRNRITRLFGSCNGLVYGWNCVLHFFFLWNPATKEYKRLPKSDSYNYGYHGFGYDSKTNDYKVVNIHEHEKSIESIDVYSLNSNSWKSLQPIKYEFTTHERSGVLLNGGLHWLVTIGETSNKVILSVDISAEEIFKELQLPITFLTTHCYMNMGVLENCLCVLAHTKESFEVWVMQDYGVLDSWIKLCTITYVSIMSNFMLGQYRFGVGLIGSYKNGEILFSDSGKIMLYDPMYGTARKLEIGDLLGGGVVKYFESLVSLNSITAVGRTKKRESARILKKTTTKKRNM